MNLQESIRRILKEDKKTKSTNKEFSKYKDSKFNSLRDYTLQDIVDDWDSLSDHKNENIKTIKHFVNNPDKITDLVYDEKGLEDGYHRLIAAKILKKPRFSYRLVENLQENIRRILREETEDITKKILNFLKRRFKVKKIPVRDEKTSRIVKTLFFEKNGKTWAIEKGLNERHQIAIILDVLITFEVIDPFNIYKRDFDYNEQKIVDAIKIFIDEVSL